MPLPQGYSWVASGGDIQRDNLFQTPTREQINQEKNFDPTANWDWQNPDQRGPQGEDLPELAIGWKPNGEADFGTGIAGWWKKTVSTVKSSYQSGYDEGVRISGVSKAIAEGVALQNATTDQQKQEAIQSVDAALAQKQAERKPTTEIGAVASGTAEAAKAVFGQALSGLLEGLGSFAVGTEQVLGTAGYSLADVVSGKKVDLATNWQASRLAYAGIFDASIYSEMERLVDSGVRGDLAAMQIQAEKPWTLWPELAGQLVYDPLNVVSAFTKLGRTIKVEKEAKAVFHTVENPALRNLIEHADEIAKMDEPTAYRRIEELVKAQQALPAVSAHAENLINAEGKLDELSKSYKMSSLTSTGKVAHLSNQTGEVLMHIVNNSSPDQALEIIRGMVLSTSSDPAKAAEGISAMMHFGDKTSLFSQAGNDTTVMLSKMYEKYGATWLENLDKLKGNKVELTNDLLGKLNKVGEEMYPSVSKMLEAEKAVAEAKEGAQLSEQTIKLAERAKQLPEYVKAATRLHDKLQTVVGPTNKFFAGIYMGWNPGYAFRNWSNNTLQILIDEGVGALVGKADNVFADAEKLHGGTIQGAFGFGSKGIIAEEAAVTGATDVKGTLKAVKEGGFKVPGQVIGGKFEENGAKRILASSYKKTFDRGLQAMTKALEPDLKAAGFSDDLIKRLPSYIMENNGDTKAVIDAIRADSAAGVIDMFGDISRIDPGYKKSLEQMGKWDEYVNNVLHAESPQAATDAATKIFDDLAQAGDYVYRDGKAATTIDDKVLAAFQGPNGLPDTRAIMVSRRQAASKETISVTQKLLNESDNLVSKFSAETGQAVDVATMKNARNIANFGQEGSLAQKEASRINELANQIYRVEMKKPKANLAELWRKYPELFPTEPPALLSKDYFSDALWTRYDELVSHAWGQGRDLSVDGVLGYFDDLKKSGVDIPEDWAKAISESRDYASQLDDALVGYKGEMVPAERLPYGTKTSQIAQIAERYGIATATEKGVPLDKKVLNIINKHAQVDYRSLEEVPLNIAEEALGIKAGVYPPIETVTQTVQISKDAGSPWVYLADNTAGIDPKQFADIMGGQFGIDKQGVFPGLFKNGGLGIDEIAVRLQEGGFITADQAKDLNYVRDYLRNATQKTATYTQEIRGGGKAAFEAQQAADKAAQKSTELATAIHDPTLPYMDEAGNLIQPNRARIMPAADPEGVPTMARAINDQMDSIGEMKRYVMDDIAKNFGRKQVINPVEEAALRKAEKELTQKIAETRLISSRVAQEARDFTLLNYGDKSYWDTTLAYLYPYHFWYKGTYGNWIKRIATNPAVLAHYNRYKENLANIHAGMPDWWKYNINTNDLPGIDTDNPLYFNLEATLWPLNGLTGTDFNDPYKRTGWWTSTLDFANKFGPSTWSPLNMVTGLALLAKGEQDAGERWMGRLLPQSNVIKAVGSKLGIGNLEVDPLVQAFQGGLDPYERRRVQRSLAAMEQDSIDGKLPYTREQIQDAAYKQEGQIWDEAVKRAVNERSGSQITSFFMGVGFKGRTPEDMQIDKFYTDYNKMWQMKDNLSTEEFKQGMNQLQQKYPFMDTVLLSRRDGVERDSGLAYLVLQRIPPGKTSEYARAVDIDPALLDKFFADKGAIDKWSDGDRLKLMSGVMNLSAVLEIPTDMTRQEWTDAKAAYSKMTKEAEGKFGNNITDIVDGYYAAKTQSQDAANNYLDHYPQVSEYMNWKAQRVMGSPLLSAYYGGSSMIEGYYRSQMYADIEKQLGKDVFTIVGEYNDIKTYGTTAEKKAYYAQNKAIINKYYDIKDSWYATIDQNVAKLSAFIPEGQPATIRPDYDITSPTQQGLVNTVQGQQPMSYQDFQQAVPERLLNIVQDYIFNSDQIPDSASTQLSRIANDLGYSTSTDLIQAIGTSMYQAQGAPAPQFP